MLRKQFQNLKVDQLTAVFLASMFGSLILTLMARSAIEPGAPVSLLSRLLFTAEAIIIYGSIVWTTFYIVVPKYRPALLNIVRSKPH